MTIKQITITLAQGEGQKEFIMNYKAEWNTSEWMEYQGFRTQGVCVLNTEENHILSEYEVKAVAVNWLGDTMSCDGIRWDVNFYADGQDEPVETVSVWTYPEDL